MSQIQSLGQISLSVTDVAAMTEFYRDKVGLKFLFSAGPTMSFFDLSGVRLMIAGPEGSQPKTQNSVLYFKVASLDDVFPSLPVSWHDKPHLIAKMPDHELWMVFFKDPESNLMGFMEERR